MNQVVNEKILARRWRACNTMSPEPFTDTAAEENWRERVLDLLSKAHTIGGISDPSLEVVESKHSVSLPAIRDFDFATYRSHPLNRTFVLS